MVTDERVSQIAMKTHLETILTHTRIAQVTFPFAVGLTIEGQAYSKSERGRAEQQSAPPPQLSIPLTLNFKTHL
jgi:hypothetical protein